MLQPDRAAAIEDHADFDRIVSRGEGAARLECRGRRAGNERLQVGLKRCLDARRQMRQARARREPRKDDLDQLLANRVQRRLRSARSLAGEAAQLGILNHGHHRGDGVLASQGSDQLLELARPRLVAPEHRDHRALVGGLVVLD